MSNDKYVGLGQLIAAERGLKPLQTLGGRQKGAGASFLLPPC